MALKCHRCQHENPNNAERCTACGTPLNATVEVQAIPDIIEDIPMTDKAEFEDKLDQTDFLPESALEAQTAKHATSDETTLNPVVDFGDEEIQELPDVAVSDDETHATTKMPQMNDDDGLLHIGTVRFRGNLILTDKETGLVYRVENEDLDEVIIGRLNVNTGFRPKIDFTDNDGKERGVSRRHATINQRGDLIFVTDHNSLNGTYLNGQRLVPEQARVVRDSDTLRIGHIMLIVAFERAAKG